MTQGEEENTRLFETGHRKICKDIKGLMDYLLCLRPLQPLRAFDIKIIGQSIQLLIQFDRRQLHPV